MSRLDDVLGRKPVEPVEVQRPVGMEVHGGFQCNICYDTTDKAEYFPNEQLLLWYCDAGHESYIEKFSIG